MPTYAESVVSDLVLTAQNLIKPIVSVTSSATPTFNAALGDYFLMTATANVSSMTISNPVAVGQVITIDILQDATGSRTLAYPSTMKFGTGVTTGTTVAAGAPTGASATASKHTIVQARWDGTNWIEISRAVDAG